MTFMAESLFIIPESFGDGTLMEAIACKDDEDVDFVAGDLSENVMPGG